MLWNIVNRLITGVEFGVKMMWILLLMVIQLSWSRAAYTKGKILILFNRFQFGYVCFLISPPPCTCRVVK